MTRGQADLWTWTSREARSGGTDSSALGAVGGGAETVGDCVCSDKGREQKWCQETTTFRTRRSQRGNEQEWPELGLMP